MNTKQNLGGDLQNGSQAGVISDKPDYNREMHDYQKLAKRCEAASYLERMCADLAVLAITSNLEFLAYLLDMARNEAAERSKDKHIKDVANAG